MSAGRRNSRRLLQFPVLVGLYARGDYPFVFAAVEQRRGDDEIGGAAVGGERHVVERCEAHETHHVVLVALHYQVVAEEDEHVHGAFGYHRPYLEIASERAAELADHFRGFVLQHLLERLPYQTAGGAGADEPAVLEHSGVVFHPVHEFRLAGIVGHESDSPDHISENLAIGLTI